jgi:hypothetical protein
VTLGLQVCVQRFGASGGEPVGAAPVVARERLDQALALEPAQRLIERARRQAHAREHLDVLGERITVLGTVGQAGQDQGGGAGRTAHGAEQGGIAAGLPRCGHEQERYTGLRCIVNRYTDGRTSSATGCGSPRTG